MGKYKHTILFLFSLLIAFFLSRLEIFHLFLLNLGELEYLGVLFAGFLFVSVFTIATSIVILSILIEKISPLEIGIIAGFGAMLGDLTIFRIIKNNLLQEITPLYKFLGGNQISKIFLSKYMKWSLPIIGAIIIASPFPDEIGITLLGISKIKTYKFLIISFILNAIGIYIAISAFSRTFTY